LADFYTHIGVSSTLGLGLAVAGYSFGDYPPVTCALAGGMCGIAGMLPDVDSENGVPLRETMTFLASVVPMMLMERVSKYYGAPLLEPESRILAAGGMYLFIRFVLAEFIRRTTVHRGMWHSIPAAALAGLLAYFLGACENVQLRMLQVVGVTMGYLSHLMLDEIYSVEEHRGRFRAKRSFGTAMKMWGPSYPANMFTYGLLLIVGTFVANEPLVQREWNQYATDQSSHEVPNGAGGLTSPTQPSLPYTTNFWEPAQPSPQFNPGAPHSEPPNSIPVSPAPEYRGDWWSQSPPYPAPQADLRGPERRYERERR